MAFKFVKYYLSLWSQHIYEKKKIIKIHESLDIEKQDTEFCFRKFELDSPKKYHKFSGIKNYFLLLNYNRKTLLNMKNRKLEFNSI